MKKHMMAALAAMAVAAMATGCTSSKITGGGQYAGIPVPQPEAYKIIYEHSPELVTGKAQVKKVFFWTFGDEAPQLLNQKGDPGFLSFLGESGETKAQNAALYNACQKSNADVILAARYKLDKSGFAPFYTVYDCEIKGFPANLKGIEKVEENGPLTVKLTK